MRPDLHVLRITALVLLTGLGECGVQGGEVVLYDSLLGTPPGSQGWLWLSTPFFGHQVTQTMGGDAVILDSTTATGDKSGYFGNGHPSVPTLDRSRGFTLRWEVQVEEEAHPSVNRAGFSVIAICDDLAGLEIGTWTNEVWAQADTPLFTHGEGAALDSGTQTNAFELLVGGDAYRLRVNGDYLLNGPLRDYTAFAGSPDVYEIPNFIFLGDDTGSAAARTHLAYVSIELWPDPAEWVATARNGEELILTADGLTAGERYTLMRADTATGGDWHGVTNLTAAGTTEAISITAFTNDASLYRLDWIP